jgi:hypothetical protein
VCLLGPRSSADQKGISHLSKTGLLDRFHLKFFGGSFGQGCCPGQEFWAEISCRKEIRQRTKKQKKRKEEERKTGRLQERNPRAQTAWPN